MSLRLFRSTGYSSILTAGETRRALHPGWIILTTSLWVGFVCNIPLWRGLFASPIDVPALARIVVLSTSIASACALVLSFLGWRKTLRPAAMLILLVAATVACAIWAQALPVGASLMEPISSLVSQWPSLLRWQVSVLLLGLGIVPTAWVGNAPVRRLPGPEQLGVNLMGMLIAGTLLAGSGFLLLG